MKKAVLQEECPFLSRTLDWTLPVLHWSTWEKGLAHVSAKTSPLERFLGGWIFNCRKVSEVKYWCRRVAIVVLRQRFWVSLQILWEVLDQGWRLVQGFGFKCWVCSMLVHEVLWRPSWQNVKEIQATKFGGATCFRCDQCKLHACKRGSTNEEENPTYTQTTQNKIS